MALPPLIPLPAGSSFDGRVLTVAGLDLANYDYELVLVDVAGAEITPLTSTVGLGPTPVGATINNGVETYPSGGNGQLTRSIDGAVKFFNVTVNGEEIYEGSDWSQPSADTLYVFNVALAAGDQIGYTYLTGGNLAPGPLPAITENTAGFYTPVSMEAQTVYGTASLSVHLALETLAAFILTHGGPANQAPTVTINGAATGTVGTQQSFQAIASDSDGQVVKVELCQMVNATSLLNYTVLDTDLVSPFVLNWTPTVAGNFNLRMRATDDKGASSFSSVLTTAVQATGGSPTPLVFTPQSNEFYPNQRNNTSSVDAGYVWRDGMACWAKRYTGTSFSFEAKSSFDSQYITTTGITLFVNDAWFGFYPLTQAGVEQTFTPTGLPAGENLLELVEGYSYRGAESGTVRVTNLTKVTFPDGSQVKPVTRAAASEAVVDLGNSRAGAGGLIDGPRYGFLRRYGRLRGAAVYLTGYSSLQMGAHVIGAANQQLLVNEAVDRLSGAATQRYVIGPDSENDWAYSTYTPAQLQAAYQQLIPKLKAALPNLLIYVATTFAQKNGWGGANGLGFTQQDYYNMEKGIAAGFSNCRTLDFASIGLTAADFADDSHLAASGEDKLLNYTISVFDNVAPPVKTYTTVYETGFDDSLALPTGLTADSNYSVVANSAAPSAPNTLRLTNTAVSSIAEITKVKVTTGRASVVMNLGCVAGLAYANLIIGQQANGNCYRIVINTSANSGKTNLFLQHAEPGSANPQVNLTATLDLDKWVGYYAISLAQLTQGALTVAIKRLSDNYYLDGATNTFVAQEANWTGNLQDSSPLPLLPGTAAVACYFDTANPGNVVDWDKLKLENYA